MSKILKTTLLALSAAAILASPVQAGNYMDGLKDLSITATPAGDLPTLTFQYDSGVWKLGKAEPKQTINLRIKAKRRRGLLINKYHIKTGNKEHRVVITQAKNFKLKKLDKSFKHKVRAKELIPFISHGRKTCEQEGHPNKIIKRKIKPGMLYWVRFDASHPSPLNSNYSFESAQAKRIPVQVICEPALMKVGDVNLTIKYDKKPGECKAHLKAAFKTNMKKGRDLNFWLYRKDGNKQKVAIKTGADGKAVFNKHYTFKKSVDRQYMVATFAGGKSITSKWTPMKIDCPPAMAVKKVTLKMKYKTLPGKCKTQVLLRASFQTNQKSNQDLNFWLYRKDGNKQQVTIKTRKDGFAYFDKSYTFNKPVDRQYMAAFVAGKAKTTPWKRMKVKCSAASSNGFQAAPKPHNN
ncbi:MAG: hypothetical protein ABJN40_02085 [Sneathiella sp.]